MLLAEANRLLTSTRLIADNKALKNSRIRTDSSRLSNAKNLQNNGESLYQKKGRRKKKNWINRINKERRKTNIQSKHKSQTNQLFVARFVDIPV